MGVAFGRKLGLGQLLRQLTHLLVICKPEGHTSLRRHVLKI